MRKTRDYQRVQRHGSRVRTSHLLILFVPSDGPGSRVGITVSRKVGNAVVRNRVKRRIRESVRMVGVSDCGNHDVVVIAHPRAANATFLTLKREIASGFAQVGENQ